MFTKFSKFASGFMVAALIATLGAGSAWAQDTTVASDAVLTPNAGLTRIEPGTWQWYSFRSQVPVDAEEDDDDVVTDPEDATINIALQTQTGAVSFEVWSADDLNNWRNDVDFDPTGVGTENEFITNDPLFWEGSFENNDDYHLIVKNTGSEPAFYTLAITGDVSLPASAAPVVDAQAAPAVEVAAPATSETAAVTTTTVQSGIPTGSVTIEPATWQWYTFRSQVPVDAEEDDDDVVTDPEDATVNIALQTQTGAVSFEVWSADDLNNWRNDVDFDPTGVGTENEFITNDPLFWEGSFQNNDTYYLVVKNNGAEAASYTLSITGNVSFPVAQ